MAELGSQAPSVELEDLPDEPGLYTLQARSDRALEALGLDDHPGQSPLVERILYLGKAQDSVRSRLRDGHFALGKTGHSTVRRTVAALLDLPAIPRPSGAAKPSRKQLMTMTANYAVPLAEDESLTAWMRSDLLVRGVATSWTPLAHLERAAGAVLKPPLDQEKVPFWAPNPWRADVAAARERKRREARQRVGLV